MENNFNDIFNLDAEAFKKPAATGGSNEVYKPTADKGKEGVYKAIIRFLPWHKAPLKSKKTKFYLWVEQPSGNFMVDCPSTVGKPSVIKELYWKFKNSESAADKQLAELFSRKERNSALIQIVKDPNNPDLEGKIMVFHFGMKINQMIESLLQPEFGEAPINPFDLFEGKLFAVHICKKAGFNNYDSCKFIGDSVAITLPGDKKPVEKTQEDMARVVDYLVKNSPDLDKYDYKEMDEEQQNKLNAFIRSVVPDGRVVDQLIGDGNSDKAIKESKPKQTATSSVKSEDIHETDVESAKPAKKAAAKPAASPSMDDLYADL
jgi:hypothetical protein